MSNIAKILVVAVVAIGGALYFYPNFQEDSVANIEPAAGTSVQSSQELAEILNNSLERANKALEEANKALEKQNTFDTDVTEAN
jgi:hypothetical protein